MNDATLQLLSRFEITAPGHLCARGSYFWFGAVFAVAGLGLLAIPIALHLQGRWQDPAWVAVAFSTLFLLAGFWIAGMRESLEVTGTEIRDVLTTWSSQNERRTSRTALQAVRLMAVVTSSGNSTTTRYVAALVIRDAAFPDPLRITARRGEAQARQDAEEIARCLALPFEDALGDELVVVEPDRLDSTRPESVAPLGTLPASIRLDMTTGGPEVWTRGTLRPLGATLAISAGVIMCASAFLVTAVVASASGDAGPVPIVIAVISGAPGLFFLGWGILSRIATERVRVLPTEVVREEHAAGVCYRTHRLQRTEIESLRVQTQSADGYGVAIVTDRGRLLVGRGLDRAGLEWLSAWLSQRI